MHDTDLTQYQANIRLFVGAYSHQTWRNGAKSEACLMLRLEFPVV